MRKIMRLLNSLRDETGTINPTRFRLSEHGSSLIFNPALPPRSPITFCVKWEDGRTRGVVSEPSLCSVWCPHLHLENLSWLEMLYLYQEIAASPYLARCDVEDDGWHGHYTLTVSENSDPLQPVKQRIPRSAPWSTHQERIDLSPGSADFQLAVRLKKEMREAKNRLHRLRRRGILACLNALGFDHTEVGYGVKFEFEKATGIYRISARDHARVSANRYQPMTSKAWESLYRDTDPTLFFQALGELYARYPFSRQWHNGSNNFTGERGISFACSPGMERTEEPPLGLLANWLEEAAHPTLTRPTDQTPDAEQLFQDYGLSATLDALDYADKGFALDFQHDSDQSLYTIDLHPAQRWTISALPAIRLYEGNARERFVRALNDFMGSWYWHQITRLDCNPHNHLVHVQVRLRRDARKSNEVREPLITWLADAPQQTEASAQLQETGTAVVRYEPPTVQPEPKKALPIRRKRYRPMPRPLASDEGRMSPEEAASWEEEFLTRGALEYFDANPDALKQLTLCFLKIGLRRHWQETQQGGTAPSGIFTTGDNQ